MRQKDKEVEEVEVERKISTLDKVKMIGGRGMGPLLLPGLPGTGFKKPSEIR